MTASESTGSRPGVRRPANPINSSQVEVLASNAASLLGLVIGAQTLPALISQFSLMMTPLGLTMVVAVFGTLVLAALAAVFRQWTGPLFGLVAGSYLAAVVFWPFVVGPIAAGDYPWIYYLSNMATGCVVVAAPRRWILALGYTVVTTALIGWLRTQPSGGEASVFEASLDAIYCFFIGLVMLVVVVSLRQAARSVDQAQAYALDSYAEAVRHNATENERVRVDALVHDNVLITLLSAARARTPATKTLAVTMARGALDHLGDAQTTFPTALADVRVEELAGRLRMAVAAQSRAFDVHVHIVDSIEVPAQIADALVEAATQAMVNSVNHAGKGVTRTVRVTSRAGEPLRVVVSDNGAGFDIGSIPAERLGVRRSIIERMEAVGGLARVDSAPGRGTSIEISWAPHDGTMSGERLPSSSVPAGLDLVSDGEKADWA